MNEKIVRSTDTPTAIADYVAAALLGLVFLPVLVFIFELFAKLDGEAKWWLPVIAGLAAPILFLTLLDGSKFPAKILAVALFLYAVADALFVASLFYDTSCDSTAYHADAILLLLQGANPVYEWMHGFDDIWVNSYPKATWYFASLLIHLTGNYNLGKSYNVLLIYAVLAYVFSFLKVRSFHAGNAFLAALAASLGPVEIAQLQTFYVDGALASLVTLALFSSLAMLAKPRGIDKAVFVMSGCLLINVKFTGLIYLYALYGICVFVMLCRWLSGRNVEDFASGRMLAGYMALVTLLGLIFMGYNPYITNTFSYHNPFFPLVGKGSTDVVAAQSPKSFNENKTPNLEKILLSIFSRSVNVVRQHGTAEPELKLPFSVHEGEMEVFAYNDVRIGGWGVLFSGILLCALALCCLPASWKNAEIAIALVFILCTMLINPGSWWARYAPQMALVPLLMAIPPATSPIRWQRISARFIFVLLLLNSLLILVPNTLYVADTSKELAISIDYAVKSCGTGAYEISDTDNYHFEQFLGQNGIHIVYPKEDIKKTLPKEELFPLENPLEKVFLHKEGCKRGAKF